MAVRLPESLKGTLTGYRCYVAYLALKLHFSSESYDFFRYGGKTNASVSSYETRRDRYQFEKLARHPEPIAVMVAHLAEDPKAWIGSISPTSDTYTEFNKRHTALAYTVRGDLSQLKDQLDDNLNVPDGGHPYLLSALIGGRVSLETACVMQAVVNFIPYWDEAIKEPIIWPQYRLKVKKLASFLEFDKDKMSDLIASKIEF